MPFSTSRIRSDSLFRGQKVASLDHKRVLAFKGVAYVVLRDEAYPAWVFTELATSGSLRARIYEGKTRMSLGHAVRFLAQAAEGLAYLHENAFVHKNLTPTNLFLDRDVPREREKCFETFTARALSVCIFQE